MTDLTTKQFAPEYERNEQGFIIFPRDVEWRRSLFCPESFKHPAKLNLYLQAAIIDFVSEPGDAILDPMSGTGSLMIATLPPDKARKVYLIEDAPLYHYFQTISKEKFVKERGVPEEYITLLQGPCQDYLPMQDFFDHVIFSPPYSVTMDMGKKRESGFNAMADDYEQYKGASSKNLGRMQPFWYNQEMVKIYTMLLQSLKPGGTMTTVVQDMMKQGKKNGLSDWVLRACIRAGFELVGWFKRYTPGTGMKQLHKSRGTAVVEDEDVIVLRRPV